MDGIISHEEGGEDEMSRQDANLKFLHCLNINQFMNVYLCFLIFMTVINLILYGVATFVVVLLDPYLDQLIHVKAPLCHTLVLVFFFGILFIKVNSFRAIYRWKK